MKRALYSLIGCAILLSPLTLHAAEKSLYELYYDQALSTMPGSTPPQPVIDYIIRSMRKWNGNGIVLTPADIAAAIDTSNGTFASTLCNKKTDVSGKPLNLDMTSHTLSCGDLKRAIRGLLDDELSVQALADDLLAITTSNELSVADEPHRPGALGTMALTARHLLTGSGAEIAAWDPALKSSLQAVAAAISSDGDTPWLVERFHYGVFRDARENDPILTKHGAATKNALLALAGALSITGDSTKTGEFSLPDIGIDNVAVWARGDDVGLMEKWPVAFPRERIEVAGKYPSFASGGTLLAYPFGYTGRFKPPSDVPYSSPLCQRTMGRTGFLCRPLTQSTNCPPTPNAATGSIELTRCNKVEKVYPAPIICSGASMLYQDHGQEIQDIDPIADAAERKNVCSPETKILYRNSLPAHACYIGLCVAQTLSGHSIVPGRNPVIAMESTDPFLSEQRQDPTLGQLFEAHPTAAPMALPAYIAVDIIRSFDRAFCEQNGLFPQALAGICAYDASRRTDTPVDQLLDQTSFIQNEYRALNSAQVTQSQLAIAIGQRFAVEQSVPVLRAAVQSFALVVQNVADLINELQYAPITQDACPWTGPLSSSSAP